VVKAGTAKNEWEIDGISGATETTRDSDACSAMRFRMLCATKRCIHEPRFITAFRPHLARKSDFLRRLGICSALAVTNPPSKRAGDGAAVTITAGCTNVIVSLLRPVLHRSVRLVVEMLVIATFVILFDVFLQAYFYNMSRELGPYVGLIVTNCILLGRAEAFPCKTPCCPACSTALAADWVCVVVLAAVAVFPKFSVWNAGRIPVHPKAHTRRTPCCCRLAHF
jgi:Na+-transporting NADH:ubiquinone oxidoreductase subunit NqrD